MTTFALTGNSWLRVAAAIGCGVMAGVFFAFSSFVMAGLDRVSPATGVSAMNSINVTAVRPLFMFAFFGTAVVSVVVLVVALLHRDQPGALRFAAAALAYLLGAVAVTAVRNVPLNDALALVDPTSAGAAGHWSTYVTQWNLWNHVRTVSCLVAAGLLIAA